MKAIIMIESLHFGTEQHPFVENPGGNICKDVSFPALPLIGQKITLGVAEDIFNDTDLDGLKVIEIFWRQVASEPTVIPIILLEKWCLGNEEDWRARFGKECEPSREDLVAGINEFFKEALEPIGFYIMSQERRGISHYGSSKKYGAELKRIKMG